MSDTLLDPLPDSPSGQPPADPGIRLRYDRGSLVVEGLSPGDVLAAETGLVWDERVGALRGHAMQYRPVVVALTREQRPYLDQARAYGALPVEREPSGEPYPYQQEALQAWLAQR